MDRAEIVNDAAERDRADALAGQICAAAALSAQSECQLLELIGEFDAIGAVGWWDGVKSMAHWLSWACSMSAGTAREHVRVARALRRMPTVRDAFATGRLSYSKVREVTRVVDVLDEARLCELALTATASQLARMLAAFRAADGSRIEAQLKRQARWQHREDGMVEFRLRLPAEEAAVVIAAVESARDRFGTVPPGPDESGAEPPQVDTTPAYGNADAFLDVAHAFLDAAPPDRSGEDRTLVVVQVSADQLTEDAEDVPAGTSADLSRGVSHVVGAGAVEAATARRLACDATVLGAVVDRHGEVLALGRSRRLVSRAQRRALMIRDRMCRYPGCHQTRHLKAHHVVPWAAGGRTDLDNLVLLCQWHHTAVHEGGMTLRRSTEDGAGWTVHFADGTRVQPWYGAEPLPYHLSDQLARRRERVARLAAVDSFDGAAARTIRPEGGGAGFNLRCCVDALFGMKAA